MCLSEGPPTPGEWWTNLLRHLPISTPRDPSLQPWVWLMKLGRHLPTPIPGGFFPIPWARLSNLVGHLPTSIPIPYMVMNAAYDMVTLAVKGLTGLSFGWKINKPNVKVKIAHLYSAAWSTGTYLQNALHLPPWQGYTTQPWSGDSKKQTTCPLRVVLDQSVP